LRKFSCKTEKTRTVKKREVPAHPSPIKGAPVCKKGGGGKGKKKGGGPKHDKTPDEEKSQIKSGRRVNQSIQE